MKTMIRVVLSTATLAGLSASLASLSRGADRFPNIPADYLRQPENIPEFWVSTVEGVTEFLQTRVRKGTVVEVGKTAGRVMRGVLYGQPRKGEGTTTFSGSLGFRDVRAYLGPDSARKVYLVFAAVHGGEFEGIVGMVNLLSVLETGKDLRGKPWPRITEAASRLDRLIVIPIVNVDGRARVPLRMMVHRGADYTVPEYFNTGGWPDGRIIGWPQCKQFIPLDFSKTQFPGGYPNDAGVNIQHDDFFSAKRQPETQALLDLTARERPDLILNMHTGAQFLKFMRPFVEPALNDAFVGLYRQVLTRLTVEGQESTDSVERETAADRVAFSPYNLDTALNLHCGALSVVVESPSHAASSGKRNGRTVYHAPDDLLNAQLLVQEETMRYLAETGGRVRWTPPRK